MNNVFQPSTGPVLPWWSVGMTRSQAAPAAPRRRPDTELVLRYAAFTSTPGGGNPAGVVLDATGLTDDDMQRIAAEVGYSETAFLFPAPPEETPDELRRGPAREFTVRYFSPLAEVPFCGHATIATAVAYAERHGSGELSLRTRAGSVAVSTAHEDGRFSATLVSVPPAVRPVPAAALEASLAALRWEAGDLDRALPPRIAYAGASHLVLATGSAQRLARLDYDMAALGTVMAEHDWTTVTLVQRTGGTEFVMRNPFPPGGVYEDPATGAAAAALGAYLRQLGAIRPPVRLTISQGTHMGRPSELIVDVGPDAGSPVSVTGAAAAIGPGHLRPGSGPGEQWGGT